MFSQSSTTTKKGNKKTWQEWNNVDAKLKKPSDLCYGLLAIGMIFRNNFEDEVPNGLPYYMQLLYICFEQENAIYAMDS